MLHQALTFAGHARDRSVPDDSLRYYARRADEARAMAAAAIDPMIRDIHLEMARQYDARVEGLTASVIRLRPAIRA